MSKSDFQEVKEVICTMRRYLEEHDEDVFLNDFLAAIEGDISAFVISMGGTGAVSSEYLELSYHQNPTVFCNNNRYIVASYSVLEDVYLDRNGDIVIMVERMHGCETMDMINYYKKHRGNKNGII